MSRHVIFRDLVRQHGLDVVEDFTLEQESELDRLWLVACKLGGRPLHLEKTDE